MASNHTKTSNSLNENSPFSPTEKQVPAALTMMVDAMTSMVKEQKSISRMLICERERTLRTSIKGQEKMLPFSIKEQEKTFKKLIKKPEKT